MNILHTSKNANVEAWIYCPEDFDPASWPGPIARHPDASRWLLHCIHHRRVVLNYGKDQFVNLHSALLAEVMGDMAIVRPLRMAMIDAGLIQCDNTYAIGSKSLGYRLGPVLTSKVFRHYRSTSKRFLKRVERYRTHCLEPKGFSDLAHSHLHAWSKRIDIAHDLEDVLSGMDKDKAEVARSQADLIRQGLIAATVCPYGRYHSNYTGLCRELRQCLSYEGTSLVEVDISNSQPYFLGCLLMEVQLSKDSENVSNLSDLMYDCMDAKSVWKREKGEGEGQEHRMSLVSSLENDLTEWVRQSTKGNLYETLMTPGTTRDELKPKVFEIIFGNKQVMDNASLSKTFKDVYPTVFNLMRTVKQSKGYAWLGQELQRREANVMIRGVGNQLREHWPSVPVLSIHDSLLTTPDNLTLIENLIRQETAPNYYRPKLKRKADG